MFVYFHNFWGGFAEKTDPIDCSFFLYLLEKVYNTTITVSMDMNQSDILVESVFGNHSLLYYKKWKSTFLFTGESYYPDYSKQHLHNYTCILGFEANYNNFVECPLFLPYIYTNPSENHINYHIPPNMASVVISNGSALERNLFLNKLDEKM